MDAYLPVMLENGVAFKKKLKTKPIIISNSCLNAERKDKKTQSYSDVPKNLKSLPKGLDPSMVAKLFFNLGTVEKNHAVWVDLLCDDLFDSKEKKELVERANDWWKRLSTNNVKYYFLRENTDRAKDDEKYFYFQREQDPKDTNQYTPILISVVLEKDGEWKVYSTMI